MAPADELASRHYPIQEDMPLQLEQWRFERIAWVALGLIVVLALLGVFSKGPFSDRRAHSADGRLGVKYQRFERYGVNTELELDVHGAGPRVTVSLRGDLLDAYAVRAIEPQPEAVRGSRDGLALDFATDGDLHAQLALQVDGMGPVATTVAVPGSAPLVVHQFIYP